MARGKKFRKAIRLGLSPHIVKKIVKQKRSGSKNRNVQTTSNSKRNFAKELFEEAELRLKNAKKNQQVFVGSYTFFLGGDLKVRLWVPPAMRKHAEKELFNQRLGTKLIVDGELFIKTSKGIMHILEANAIGLGPIQE